MLSGEGLSEGLTRVLGYDPRDKPDPTRLLGTVTQDQITAAGRWVAYLQRDRDLLPELHKDGARVGVQLYALEDGSLGVHIGDDLHTNIDPDGRVNG